MSFWDSAFELLTAVTVLSNPHQDARPVDQASATIVDPQAAPLLSTSADSPVNNPFLGRSLFPGSNDWCDAVDVSTRPQALTDMMIDELHYTADPSDSQEALYRPGCSTTSHTTHTFDLDEYFSIYPQYEEYRAYAPK